MLLMRLDHWCWLTSKLEERLETGINRILNSRWICGSIVLKEDLDCNLLLSCSHKYEVCNIECVMKIWRRTSNTSCCLICWPACCLFPTSVFSWPRMILESLLVVHLLIFILPALVSFLGIRLICSASIGIHSAYYSEQFHVCILIFDQDCACWIRILEIPGYTHWVMITEGKWRNFTL